MEAVLVEVPEAIKESNSNSPDLQLPNNNKKNEEDNTYTGQTIIMCDSNGRLLNIRHLCPKSTTSYIRCPTLKHAEEIINTSNFSNPQTLIFHCSTNK